ncbi:cysteine-rich and transmembrane domain-containing protein WIH1 [Carica papaya]|uniref:cysteine-rich and transmembrane domain-containing protein WIH1 n=1 Tax=Carica papaya TaxID=3649 RepID=UPI000B8CA698|nr:cysteine-rich and transmembrane domain-containing protein WIH1 [Carica papaya]
MPHDPHLNPLSISPSSSVLFSAKRMEPKFAHPYPPPVMPPPQYYAPPPRREPGFLEGCLAALCCCCLLDECCCDPSIVCIDY